MQIAGVCLLQLQTIAVLWKTGISSWLEAVVKMAGSNS